MKICYITGDDPHSVSGWSGLTSFIGNSLKSAGNDLSYVNSFKLKNSLVLRLKQKLYPKLSGKFIQPNRYPYIINQYSKQITAKLAGLGRPDVLFSNSSEMIAAASENIPKAFWVDASFAGMLGYYREFSILHPETIKKANQLEQKAYDKASLIFFASDWAAKTAIDNYKIQPDKVKVVPFGANLTASPSRNEVWEDIAKKSTTHCDLLFIGVYWERKGGPLAVRITEELNSNGINATLTIVGCTPFKEHSKPYFVKQRGFLSKDIPEQKKILEDLLRKSHFLLVPTQAECYGLVYCEANAFGLPVLATLTGGVPTIIKDDINGKLFSLEAKADNYCSYIESVFSNFEKYRSLSVQSHEEFETRLNWKVAGTTVSNYLQNLL